MRSRTQSPLPLAIAVGFLSGLYGSALWSTERTQWRTPLLAEAKRLARMEAVQVLPRTQATVLAIRARTALERGRPWEAWQLLRDEVDAADAPAAHVVLAAEAAAGWGGWRTVVRLLSDRPWLYQAEGGEGAYLLARAQEETGERSAAAATYRRYLGRTGARHAGTARARLGRVLLRSGSPAAAAAAFGAAAESLGEVEDWMRALQVDAAARAGDAAGAAALAARLGGGSAPARARWALSEAGAWVAAGNPTQAIARLDAQSQALRARGAVAEAAELQLERGRLLVRTRREAEARDALRGVAADPGALSDHRLAAARLLGELNGLTAADELARSAGYEAAGRPGLAARSLRSAMTAAGMSDGATYLRWARLLYEARDFGPARVAFRRAAELLQDPEQVAEAQVLAARSLYRGAGGSRFDAIPEFRQVAERFPGTAAAATALFLLGDASSNPERGLEWYRRAAAIAHAPDAREALFRVGDRYLRLGNPAAALRAWGEYVERYPTGDATARVAYRAARLHERAGREGAARALYQAAMRADPVSYHAFRAGNRAGSDPLRRIAGETRAWPGLPSDPADAAVVLRRLDALEAAGLTEPWEAELAGALRTFADRPAALLALAEGLRDRNHPVQGIRIGRQLAARGQWDGRLLRVVFPLPYRELLEEEAERVDIDPMLLAGLVRQESSFRSDARSRVGATGLGQIMPSTGEWLAPRVGIRNFERDLLEVPEINLRMGALYLRDLLRRYDGARDLALAAYNAGPSRADRWRRELGYGRDVDAFREAIPFDETREYVQLVLRNASVYSRLYGRQRDEGLVRGDEER